MLPSPLHPAMVHFPIVLMLILPIAAVAALWSIRRGGPAVRAWSLPLAVSAALTLSAWVALETGEREEDRAEPLVGERAIDAHEAAAQRFLALSGAMLVLTGAGLVPGRVGQMARLTGTAAVLGLVIAGYQVGHSGGRLVYGDGTVGGMVGSSGGQGGPGGGDTGMDSARDDD